MHTTRTGRRTGRRTSATAPAPLAKQSHGIPNVSLSTCVEIRGKHLVPDNASLQSMVRLEGPLTGLVSSLGSIEEV